MLRWLSARLYMARAFSNQVIASAGSPISSRLKPVLWVNTASPYSSPAAVNASYASAKHSAGVRLLVQPDVDDALVVEAAAHRRHAGHVLGRLASELVDVQQVTGILMPVEHVQTGREPPDMVVVAEVRGAVGTGDEVRPLRHQPAQCLVGAAEAQSLDRLGRCEVRHVLVLPEQVRPRVAGGAQVEVEHPAGGARAVLGAGSSAATVSAA